MKTSAPRMALGMGHSPFLRSEAGGFCLEAFEGFRFFDDETRVVAGPDIVELVLDGNFESDLASFHRCDTHRDLDRHPHEGGREMLDRDFHAHRILARVGMLDDELAAGMLDVEDHGGGCIGACLLAHEPDRALAPDSNAV